MIRKSVSSFIRTHRIAFALFGIVVTTGVVIPACSGDATGTIANIELSVTKTARVNGQVVTYTITVSNHGTTAVSNLVVTDAVQNAPAGSAFTASTGATCSGPITAYLCTVPQILAGQSSTITLNLTVPSGVSGGFENCASIPADSVTTNNRSCAGANVVAPPATSAITIVKDAVPNSAQDFDFTTTNMVVGQFRLDDDSDPALSNQQVFSNLAAGTYTFTEAATAGWSLTGIACTPSAGATVNLTSRSVSIALVAGTPVTCTFTNTALAPAITSITPATPTGSAEAQALTINGTNFAAGATVTLRNTTTNQTNANVGIGSTLSTAIVINPVLTPAASNQDWSVQVTSAAGLASNVFPFTVTAPTPTITSITTTPTQARAGTSTIFTISGTNFISDASRILVNGPRCTPCVIANSALTTKTATSLIGPMTFPEAGTFMITVQNAVSGGATGTTGPTSAARAVVVTAGTAGG